jgi:hypothetical protein
LHSNSITNFKELAATNAKHIKDILDGAGSKFKMHNPASWPEQSKLASDGKWDELSKLQAKLNAGKA